VAFYLSAPALAKVCFGSWPRAQGWPCVGFGLWHLLGLLGRAVCWHWPLAVRQAIFRAAGRVSILALGRVSVRVRLCGGIGLWPCFSPDKRALAKNKAPNFRSLHEAKELDFNFPMRP